MVMRILYLFICFKLVWVFFGRSWIFRVYSRNCGGVDIILVEMLGVVKERKIDWKVFWIIWKYRFIK